MQEAQQAEEANEAEEEVRALHRFFVHWFRADAPLEEFGVLERALGAGFTLVDPSGQRLEREPLLEGLRAARGSRAEDEPRFRIEVREPRSRPLAPGLVLVEYEEWQLGAEGESARWSSALLRRLEPGAPWIWLHVHETWLVAPRPA